MRKFGILAMLSASATTLMATELFDGIRSGNDVLKYIAGKHGFVEYPELYRIEYIGADGIKNNISGNWDHFDRSGNAQIANFSVKISILEDKNHLRFNISLTPKNQEKIFSVRYPLLALPLSNAEDERLIVPEQYGKMILHPSAFNEYANGSLPRLHKAVWFGPYGGFRQSLQMIVYEKNQRSMMFWSQDRQFNAKDFLVTKYDALPEFADKILLFSLRLFPENSQTGNVPAVVSFFDSAYDAAKCYREWALQQKWCEAGSLMKRIRNKELPEWFRDNTVWVTAVNRHNLPMLEELSGVLPFTQFGVFLTQWQQFPFDVNVPEFFPPKDETGHYALMSAQDRLRMHIVPYMNMHLVDGDYPAGLKKFTPALSVRPPEGAFFNTPGEVLTKYIEEWGRITLPDGTTRKRHMSPLCRSSKLWNDAYLKMCNRGMQHYGAHGQYFDQMGVYVYPCWSTEHNHAPGMGTYLLEGSRAMLRQARNANPGKLLMGEHVSEVYVGEADQCYSIWPAYYSAKEKLFPLFPLVYQDYISLHEWFIPPATLKNHSDFAYALALSVHFGHKIGSFVLIETWYELLKRENSKAMFFLKQLEAGLRSSHSVYGEMLHIPEISGNEEITVNVFESQTQSRPVTAAAVTASAWRLPENGKIALLLTNISENPQSVMGASPYLDGVTSGVDIQTGDIFAVARGKMKIEMKPLSARLLILERSSK